MTTVQTQSSGAPIQSATQAAAQMAAAARRFVDSLTAEQKAMATFEYMDGGADVLVLPAHQSPRPRAARHGTPTSGSLPLPCWPPALLPAPTSRPGKLLSTRTCSARWKKKWGMITFVRDVELYYFTIFGEPGGNEAVGLALRGASRLAAFQRVGR